MEGRNPARFPRYTFSLSVRCKNELITCPQGRFVVFLNPLLLFLLPLRHTNARDNPASQQHQPIPETPAIVPSHLRGDTRCVFLSYPVARTPLDPPLTVSNSFERLVRVKSHHALSELAQIASFGSSSTLGTTFVLASVVLDFASELFVSLSLPRDAEDFFICCHIAVFFVHVSTLCACVSL